jgi:hypothetical protein
MQTRSRLRHQLALGLIMAALIPVAGLQAVWSADEGALLYQIRSLSEGTGWTFTHPYPEADPDGNAFPIHLSSWAENRSQDRADSQSQDRADGPWYQADGPRYIVLAKHTAYLWIAAGLYGLGGYGLVVVLSVLSGLAAAIATSRLASLLDPDAERPALWVAGLASPLLLHSYVAWGHTVAAALVAWGTYWLVRDRQPTASAWSIGAGLAMLFGACLIRTEAPLAVLAIGLAMAADRRRLGWVVVTVGAAGRIVDQLTDVATGGPVEPVSSTWSLVDFAAGRIEGFTITWLLPSYGRAPIDLTIAVAAACVLAAAVVARRGGNAIRLSWLLLTVAAGAVAFRFAGARSALVPGLVVAFPALFGGLALLGRHTLADRRARVLLGGFVLFCGAVLATQYRQGGGGEWGGRYFATGLPFGLAVATASVMHAARGLTTAQRRRLAVPLVASMVLMSTMGILGLRVSRQMTDQLATEIGATVDGLAFAAEQGGDRPVVVSTIAGLGRWMWADIDEGRWLRIGRSDLAPTARRLHVLGVDQLIVVTRRPDAEVAEFAPWFEPVPGSSTERSSDQVVVLRAVGD